jgi:hypothetical protein
LNRSEVWKRIVSDDPDELMPPPTSHKKLTAEQKATLKRWIEQGAPYQKHWAFESPVAVAEPKVRNTAWPHNGIDHFVLARLEQQALAPQPEADRETLIRRVAFALTGLPPTIAEVDQYLADSSTDAYEKMVDRYLASPRYGEEMARHWLDVARYADTHGLHLDNERHMWAYRDWVVQAFNQNLPFDQFTIWQLAGDLLPNPTLDQLTATGFNRCNVTTSEGGSINEEFVYRYAVDRTSTMVQTWLGLTGGCAVCHDHKYDPLSSREFYSLYAFFNSAADPGMDRNVKNTDPFLKLARPPQQALLEKTTRIEQRRTRLLEQAAARVEYRDPAEHGRSRRKQPVTDTIFDDFFALGSVVKNTSRNAADWIADPPFGAPSGRRVLRQASAHFFEDTVQPQLRLLVIPDAATFEVWLRTDPLSEPKAVSIVVTGAAGNRRVYWGDEDDLDGGFPSIENPKRVGSLPKPGQWTLLSFTPADLGMKAGDRVSSLALQQVGGVVWWDALAVRGFADPTTDPLTSFNAWWKAQSKKTPADIPEKLKAALAAGPQSDTPRRTRQALQNFYLAHVARPASDELGKLRHQWEESRVAQSAADYAIVGTMIFRDLDKPRDSFVMLRGQYDKRGEQVEPSVPAILPPLKVPQGHRPNRLDLAQWLVSPEQPLTARVQVNRLWQQLFGIGLVKTSYDFGSQGEMPSHPELLDWLAVQYRNSGWDTKRLVRNILLSSTFRQRSYQSPELRTRDPENRLLAHGPRFRLDAEQIRDNALFTSGLLNLQMGGRGVNPYQPPNIWEPVGYSDSNTRYYLQDHGPALYRRSLYVFLKRTAPPPFMSNFDGPNREQFCTRRERSNTPLQALQLMNDVQHFESARALAERVLAEAGKSDDDRIAYLYRTVLSRRPAADELKLIKQAYDVQYKLFAADQAAAAKAVAVGESRPKHLADDATTAAWTLIANLVLNLDETLNRN